MGRFVGFNVVLDVLVNRNTIAYVDMRTICSIVICSYDQYAYLDILLLTYDAYGVVVHSASTNPFSLWSQRFDMQPGGVE